MGESHNASTFLFVNKTGSSDVLTRSYEAEERFTILSHVQNRRRQKGKRREEKTEPWTRYTSHMTLTSEKKETTTIDEGNCRVKRKKEQADPLALLGRHTRRTSPLLPQTYPTNNGADPFHCTVVGSDACTHAMLHYAFSSVAKKTFLAEAFAFSTVVQPERRAMRHAHIMEERLRRCVDDEMLMYSTLAYGSSCLAWSTGQYEDNKPPEYYIGKALQAVRMRLSLKGPKKQRADVWLLLSIYALTITEFWAGLPEIWTKCPARYISILNMEKPSGLKASRIHMRALLAVVEDAGGWKNIDPYVLESAILADKYQAIDEMTKPVIPLTWDPGPLPKARQDELQIQPESTFPRLGLKLLEEQMCPKLGQVVREVIDYVRTAHCAWSRVDMLTSFDENWLFLRHQALIYQLLSLPKSIGSSEECIRITTLLFLLNSTEYHGAHVSARATLQHSCSALVRAQFWEESFGNDLRFWCLCTGATVSEPSRERNWFQGMLARFHTPPSCIWTKQGIYEELEQYLFLAEKQESQLSRLVNDLNARGDMLLLLEDVDFA